MNYDLRIASPNDLKVTIIINYIFRPRKARSDLRANWYVIIVNYEKF